MMADYHDSYGSSSSAGSMSPASACSSSADGEASDLDDFLLGPDGGSLFDGFEDTREMLTAVEAVEAADGGVGVGSTVFHFRAQPQQQHRPAAPRAEERQQQARGYDAADEDEFRARQQAERERRARQQTEAARMARSRSSGSAGYTRDTRLPAPHAIDKSQRFKWKSETERILRETREKLESYSQYRRLLDDAHDWDGAGDGAASRKRRREEFEAAHRPASPGSAGEADDEDAERKAKRRSMTAKQRLQARKDRKNKREKQRRSDVNVMFMTLIDMLGLRPDIKSDKVTILSGAVNHINALRAQNEALLQRVRGGAAVPAGQ